MRATLQGMPGRPPVAVYPGRVAATDGEQTGRSRLDCLAADRHACLIIDQALQAMAPDQRRLPNEMQQPLKGLEFCL